MFQTTKKPLARFLQGAFNIPTKSAISQLDLISSQLAGENTVDELEMSRRLAGIQALERHAPTRLGDRPHSRSGTDPIPGHSRSDPSLPHGPVRTRLPTAALRNGRREARADEADARRARLGLKAIAMLSAFPPGHACRRCHGNSAARILPRDASDCTAFIKTVSPKPFSNRRNFCERSCGWPTA